MANRTIEILNTEPVPFNLTDNEKQTINYSPTNQMSWIKSASPKLKQFLDDGIDTIAKDTEVTRVRKEANTKLNHLKTLNITGFTNKQLVIGGKRTKRAKTSNRKTKNKRKKPHKRN